MTGINHNNCCLIHAASVVPTRGSLAREHRLPVQQVLADRVLVQFDPETGRFGDLDVPVSDQRFIAPEHVGHQSTSRAWYSSTSKFGTAVARWTQAIVPTGLQTLCGENTT